MMVIIGRRCAGALILPSLLSGQVEPRFVTKVPPIDSEIFYSIGRRKAARVMTPCFSSGDKSFPIRELITQARARDNCPLPDSATSRKWRGIVYRIARYHKLRI